jgi:uncharacterized membrane protein YkvI
MDGSEQEKSAFSPTLFAALLLAVVGAIMLFALTYPGLAVVKVAIALACIICAGYFLHRSRRERKPPGSGTPDG